MTDQKSFKIRGWGCLLVLLVGLVVVAPAQAGLKGETPPDFKQIDLGGNEVQLSDFRGRPIILKMATTWCGSCLQQIKELSKIESFIVENDIALIEVYVDDESEETVRAYLQQRDFTVPHVALVDDGHVVRAYRLRGVPRVLLIDPDFKVQRDGHVITATDLKSLLKKMLKK